MAVEGGRDLWVGFDLGGTKMLAQVYDSQYKILGKDRRKTRSSDKAESGLDRVALTIRTAMEVAQVDPSRLAGIGIGCPGPVDMDRGIVLNPPNLGWDDVNVRKRLEAEFNCPVAVINDVDAGVYGEYRRGAAQGARCAVGVFPGTGIGGGCVYQGEIFRGRNSSCLELGHIPMVPNGPLCGCGQRGCLEAIASRTAIAAQVARAVLRGDAPALAKSVGADVEKIRSGDLAASIQAGDHVVEEIVYDAARSLGAGVAAIVNLLCPDVVVMGGGLVEAMPEIFVDYLQKVARKRVMTSYRRSFSVVAAQLQDDAGATGAAAWVRHVVQGD
ncbi:MAG: ROK family protein [Planctomycetota bacterium]|nr:MAG: ROK family protein [Planctomycetota bacterium]